MPEAPLPGSLPAIRWSVRAFAPFCPLLMNVSAEVFLETACYVSGTCHVISPGSGKEGGREGGRGAEGERRRGKMEAEEGGKDGRLPAAAPLRRTFSSPFSPAALFLFLWVDLEPFLMFLNSRPHPAGRSLSSRRAEPALFLA